MALSVQTNNAAMTALKHLNANNNAMNNSLERLSSGFRVNNAADDASGYAVSSKLDAQTERLKAASLNATQAQAMTKMADAGVNEIQNMVVRIQTLATQAASANSAGELGKLDAERIKLEGAIDKIANSTNYNGVNLLNGEDNTAAAVVGTATTHTAVVNQAVAGSLATVSTTGTALYTQNASFTVETDAAGAITSITSAADLTDINGAVLQTAGTAMTIAEATAATGLTFSSTANATTTAGTTTISSDAGGVSYKAHADYTQAATFQVGADNDANNQVVVDLRNKYTTEGLGLGGGDLTSQANAKAYIDTTKAALDKLVNQRADLGATQNQVAFIQSNLSTSIEQATASVSAIRDADMAAEMAEFTKNQILTQASTSMLAQANQAAQNVMTLFR